MDALTLGDIALMYEVDITSFGYDLFVLLVAGLEMRLREGRTGHIIGGVVDEICERGALSRREFYSIMYHAVKPMLGCEYLSKMGFPPAANTTTALAISAAEYIVENFS